MLISITAYIASLIAFMALSSRFPLLETPLKVKGYVPTPIFFMLFGVLIVLVSAFSTWELFQGARTGEIDRMFVRGHSVVLQTDSPNKFLTHLLIRALATPFLLTVGIRMYSYGRGLKARP